MLTRLGRYCAVTNYPFRPFFLLTGLFATLVIPAWLAMVGGIIPLPAGMPPTWWHAHEMLYGFVASAAAGFLLTAMPNWTGVPPPKNGPLLALVGLWLAGRIAMVSLAWLPTWLVALVDMAFLPILAAVGLRMLVIAGNRRNLPIIGVLLGLALGNAVMHAAVAGWLPSLALIGERVGMDLVALLIAIIGGRITPAFTRNWLNRHGADGNAVRTWPWLEYTALASLVALVGLDIAGLDGPAVAVTALIAGAAHTARLMGWQGWRAISDGLVWILHLGYAWLAAALILRGLGAMAIGIAPSVWIHALGVGAMGTMILGVMARVSVAHTGHGLILRPGGLVMFGLITLAAVLRLGAAAGMAYGSLYGAGLAWTAAFALFVISYGPVLLSPRIDGKPG